MYQYNKYFYKYTLSFIHNIISKYLQTRKGLTIPNGKNEEKTLHLHSHFSKQIRLECI